MMRTNAAVTPLPDVPQSGLSEAEQSIVQGLLYLEREACSADLLDLARSIRSAVETYTESRKDRDS